jgi:hypothetical protein
LIEVDIDELGRRNHYQRLSYHTVEWSTLRDLLKRGAVAAGDKVGRDSGRRHAQHAHLRAKHAGERHGLVSSAALAAQ